MLQHGSHSVGSWNLNNFGLDYLDDKNKLQTFNRTACCRLLFQQRRQRNTQIGNFSLQLPFRFKSLSWDPLSPHRIIPIIAPQIGLGHPAIGVARPSTEVVHRKWTLLPVAIASLRRFVWNLKSSRTPVLPRILGNNISVLLYPAW